MPSNLKKIAAPQVHIVDYSTVYAKSLDFFKKYCIIIIAIRFRNTKLKVYYNETEKNMNIGPKIKQLRMLNGLTQEELADRSELSKGFISQLENDVTSPSIATLEDILQCLGTTLSEFFSEEDSHVQKVFGPEDYFEKKDDELGSMTEWIIPNAQKNMMEPIRLTLAAGGHVSRQSARRGGIRICPERRNCYYDWQRTLESQGGGVVLLHSRQKALHYFEERSRNSVGERAAEFLKEKWL